MSHLKGTMSWQKPFSAKDAFGGKSKHASSSLVSPSFAQECDFQEVLGSVKSVPFLRQLINKNQMPTFAHSPVSQVVSQSSDHLVQHVMST